MPIPKEAKAAAYRSLVVELLKDFNHLVSANGTPRSAELTRQLQEKMAKRLEELDKQ